MLTTENMKEEEDDRFAMKMSKKATSGSYKICTMIYRVLHLHGVGVVGSVEK